MRRSADKAAFETSRERCSNNRYACLAASFNRSREAICATISSCPSCTRTSSWISLSSVDHQSRGSPSSSENPNQRSGPNHRPCSAFTRPAGGMSGGRRVTVRAGAGDGGVVHGRGFPGRLRVTGGADRAVARAVFNCVTAGAGPRQTRVDSVLVTRGASKRRVIAC